MNSRIPDNFWKKANVVLAVIAIFTLGYWLGGPDKDETSAEQKQVRWTCSMHPEFKLPKPGLCPKCNMALIPLELDDDADETETKLVVSEAAAKLMDVEVVPAERKFVASEVRMIGKVDYNETKLSYITAWVAGRLDKLYVDYTGIYVNKGDHLVYMYSPELISAQEELLQAIKAAKTTQQGIMSQMSTNTADAAREKLRLWGLTTEQIANIEKTGEVSEHVTIYAPTSGVVIHKNAMEGMYVETGTKIYTIADLSKVWVKLNAYESDLGWLAYGQAVEFTTVSYPGETFSGTISFIDPILDEKTRTVKVRVSVDNPGGKLKPGMFVKATVQSDMAEAGTITIAEIAGKWICPMHPEVIKDAKESCGICGMDLVTTESMGYVTETAETSEKPLVIPAAAALITGKRAIVYVRLPDTEKPTFVPREVELGPRAGEYYIVRKGLKEGELVVVNGSFKIDSSLQIKAKPSMMSMKPEHKHPRKLDSEFRDQIGKLFEAYLSAQQNLAADNAGASAESIKEMSSSLKLVNSKLLPENDLAMWLKHSTELRKTLSHADHAKDIESVRKLFHKLSEQLIIIAEHFGSVFDEPIYKAHCPMAFDNTGADWLQRTDKIRNPYFGSRMLKCGTVKKRIEPR